MPRARNLAVTAAAVVALAGAVAFSGAGSAVAETMKPLLVKDVREPFTVSMSANAGVNEGTNCQDVPLPAGNLVIENVNGGFSGPVDAHLSLWESAIITPPGGQPSLGRSSTYVRLEGIQQNLASNAGQGVRFEGLLLIADGMPTVPNRLFRNSDNPVMFCAEDAQEGIGHGGPVQISGYLLP